MLKSAHFSDLSYFHLRARPTKCGSRPITSESRIRSRRRNSAVIPGYVLDKPDQARLHHLRRKRCFSEGQRHGTNLRDRVWENLDGMACRVFTFSTLEEVCENRPRQVFWLSDQPPPEAFPALASGAISGAVPDHSGGSAPDFHRLPCSTESVAPRTFFRVPS